MKLISSHRTVQILPDRVMASSTVSYDFTDGSQADVKAFAIIHKGLNVSLTPAVFRVHAFTHAYHLRKRRLISTTSTGISPAYQALQSKVTVLESR